MSNVIAFPEPVREMVVVRLYSAVMPRHYSLVIVDPEIGEIYPTKCSGRPAIQEMIEALSDDAKARKLDFEVHDFSSRSTLFLWDNGNG